MNTITYRQICQMISDIEAESYELLNNQELVWLLRSDIAEERGIAAKLLGERESIEALPFLCKALETENDKSIGLILAESLKCLVSAKK